MISEINFRIYFAAIVACFAAVIIGYDAGFIGGTVVLPEFVKEFGFEELDPSAVALHKANIISLFHAGAFFGSYLIYPIAIYWGRLWGFRISGVFITFGSAIQLISNSSRGLSALLAGRFISGVGIGAVSNLAPMYVSEIAPASIRGRLVGMYEVAWQVGGVVGFFINYGVEQHMSGPPQWLVPIAIQCIPSGLFTIGVFFIPESPRWHLTKENTPGAIKSLSWLRRKHHESDEILSELAVMEAENMQRRAAINSEFWDPFKLLLLNKSLRFRLLQTLCLFIFQNATGINAINYYSVSMFRTIGISSTSAGLLSTGVFGIIKGISCFIWAFYVVDKFGRKGPLMLFSFVCIFALWYLGAYIKIARPEETLNGEADGGSRSALAFFYIWTIGYAFSWSGIPWVYMSEVFEAKVRNLAQCFNASSNWFWAFIMARFTQQMIDSMKYGIFFFFASLLCCSILIFMLFYPETRHIPIDDVHMLFDGDVPPYKAHKRALKIIENRGKNVDYEVVTEAKSTDNLV